MEHFNRKTVRYRDDMQSDQEASSSYKHRFNAFSSERTYSLSDSVRKGSEGLRSIGKSLRTGVSKVFAEDHKASKKIVLDPNSNFVQQWNKVFLVSCVVALFLDPLFFFLPALSADDECIKIQKPLEVVVTVLRTITDTFYLFHMALQFRTAYVAPSSRVFGRGVLVVNPKSIAKRYLLRDFWLDLIAVLPIPQVVIWAIVPSSKGPVAYKTKNALRFIVFLQYIPRLYLIFPLILQIVKSTGLVTETAWAGAAYNLVLYILASHFIGACWYLLAIERKDTCWREQCKIEKNSCSYDYLYCGEAHDPNERDIWLINTSVFNNCQTSSTVFDFGIYKVAFDKNVVTAKFMNKYLFCLWFGLQQLRRRVVNSKSKRTSNQRRNKRHLWLNSDALLATPKGIVSKIFQSERRSSKAQLPQLAPPPVAPATNTVLTSGSKSSRFCSKISRRPPHTIRFSLCPWLCKGQKFTILSGTGSTKDILSLTCNLMCWILMVTPGICTEITEGRESTVHGSIVYI